MPFYEYRCGCGNYREVMKPFHRMNEREICDECGNRMKRKEISVTNFHLIGEGWGKHGYIKESEIADYELGPVDKSEWE